MGYAVKDERVIYHKVIIAENQPVSFSSFAFRGDGRVCRQFREEYADTFNQHIHHLANVGDIDGNKLFDPDRYPRGFRSKIALVRKDNSPLWECHPVLPSLRHLKLLSSFTSIFFEAFQGHYTMTPDEEQKISVSFEFPLSTQARKCVRHQEASIYNHIFTSGKLESYMRSHSKDLSGSPAKQSQIYRGCRDSEVVTLRWSELLPTEQAWRVCSKCTTVCEPCMGRRVIVGEREDGDCKDQEYNGGKRWTAVGRMCYCVSAFITIAIGSDERDHLLQAPTSPRRRTP